jgi:hypothetical protein
VVVGAGEAAEKIAQNTIVVVALVQIGLLVVSEAELMIGKVKLVRADADDWAVLTMKLLQCLQPVIFDKDVICFKQL